MSSSFASFKRDGVPALFFIQIFATMAYAVLYSTIVLYATKKLGLSADVANSIVASFVAFNFTLHLLGGYIGGRFMSFRSLFLMCTTFQILGNLLMMSVSVSSLYIGLAFFLAGSGFNSICINCMLTQVFKKEEDQIRQNAFLWNYSGMNFGFMVGFFIAGCFQITQNYETLFLLASFSNVIALIATVLRWKKFADVNTHISEVPLNLRKRYSIICALTSLGVAFLLIWLLRHANFSSDLIMWIGGITALVLCILALRLKNPLSQKRLWAFNILTLASVLFFTLYQLMPMALTLFTENNVNRMMFGFIVPPQWFLNVDSIVVIIGGPLIASFLHAMHKRGITANIPALFASGLILMGVAFLIFRLGIYFADSKGLVSAFWVMFGYTIFACGELCLSPIGYSMVGLLAPTKLRGFLMGVTLLCSGVAATFANYFSRITLNNAQSAAPFATNPSYGHTFFMLGAASIVAGLILVCFVPFILKLIRSASANTENHLG